jgi:hypothetical protein
MISRPFAAFCCFAISFSPLASMPAKRRARGAAKSRAEPAKHTEASPGPQTPDRRGAARIAAQSGPKPHSPDPDIGVGEAAAQGPPSETGTYDGEAFDPALVDEEETPTGGGAPVGPAKSGYSGGFNAMKSFQGQMYTGMAVGGSHTWNYQPGVWKVRSGADPVVSSASRTID